MGDTASWGSSPEVLAGVADGFGLEHVVEEIPAHPWLVTGSCDGWRWALRERDAGVWELRVAPADDPRGEPEVVLAQGVVPQGWWGPDGRPVPAVALRTVATTIRSAARQAACDHTLYTTVIDAFCSHCGQAIADPALPYDPVSDLVEALRAELANRDPKPLAVVLLGSVARGTAHPHSDVDFIIVPPDGIGEPWEDQLASTIAALTDSMLDLPADTVFLPAERLPGLDPALVDELEREAVMITGDLEWFLGQARKPWPDAWVAAMRRQRRPAARRKKRLHPARTPLTRGSRVLRGVADRSGAARYAWLARARADAAAAAREDLNREGPAW